MDNLAVFDINEELKRLNITHEALESNTSALSEEIDIAHETEDPRSDRLDALIEQYEDGYEELKSVFNKAEVIKVIDNVRKAMEDSKKYPDFKHLDYAIYVEGRLKEDEFLTMLKLEKDAYELGSIQNPMQLIGNIRNVAEKEVKNYKALLIKAIPVKTNLLRPLTDKEMAKGYKAVYLAAYDALEARFKYRNIPEVDNFIALKSFGIDALELPLLMADTYEAALDACIPIFRGFDKYMDEKAKKLREIEKEIETKTDNFALRGKEYDIQEAKIAIQVKDIDNKTNQIRQLDETIAERKAEIERLKQEKLALLSTPIGTGNNDEEDEN